MFRIISRAGAGIVGFVALPSLYACSDGAWLYRRDLSTDGTATGGTATGGTATGGMNTRNAALGGAATGGAATGGTATGGTTTGGTATGGAATGGAATGGTVIGGEAGNAGSSFAWAGGTTSGGATTSMAGSASRMGMTWTGAGEALISLDGVGCSPCDPSIGDTSCSTALPLLCLRPEQLTRPNYAVLVWSSTQVMPSEYYRGWSGGYVGLTAPVEGTKLTSPKVADDICAAELGEGYRWAEFHDGKYLDGMDLDYFFGATWDTAIVKSGGWSFYAYGNVSNSTRFWTFINNQAANCWQGDKKKGMTWAKLGAPPTAINGVVCGNSGNPYVGDTLCTESRPILCLNPEGSWRENYMVPTRDAAPYYGWSGGHVKFTSAVAGTSLKSLANANGLCASQFGAGYRMAEFHDGQYVSGMGTDAYFGSSWASATKYSGGAGFFAYGTVPSGRFWTYINDKPANCWDE